MCECDTIQTTKENKKVRLGKKTTEGESKWGGQREQITKNEPERNQITVIHLLLS